MSRVRYVQHHRDGDTIVCIEWSETVAIERVAWTSHSLIVVARELGKPFSSTRNAIARDLLVAGKTHRISKSRNAVINITRMGKKS